mmetsp:Transcript_56110/g.63498  ORF Transcript_56110/g.63498 Transcript_56110/m.63498 type:complete len:425 (-) Transcript_56110:82-1356(-)
MKLSFAFGLLLTGFLRSARSQEVTDELPEISSLIELAFPTWCIDENENRLTELETCSDGSPNGIWTPIYLGKRNSSADPALGGYPTPLDTVYPFEEAAPFMGQVGAGTSYHCSKDFDGRNEDYKKGCRTTNTDYDNGPGGPGKIPPHIALAAVTRAYNEQKVGDISEWFDHGYSACRILPHKLLQMIRLYYPRVDGKAYYPPPFSTAGGFYEYEFVNIAGSSCDDEKVKHSSAGELICFEQHSGETSLYPDYLAVGHGSPRYCAKEVMEADTPTDWCPYIFFGPNRGKYRHPHIAYASVETYLANKVMPDKCAPAWDTTNYPPAVDTSLAFPVMNDDIPAVGDEKFKAPSQPAIIDGKWVWPGPDGVKRKPVVGKFETHIYVGLSSADDGEPSGNAATSATLMISAKLINFFIATIAIAVGGIL